MSPAPEIAVISPIPVKGRLGALMHAPWPVKGALLIILAYCTIALAAPVIAPYGEAEVVSPLSYEPWSEKFIFGTDELGRDVLSRLIYAARNSLGIAALTTAIAFSLGGTLGMLAAMSKGVVDQAMSRVVDIIMSVPPLILILILLTAFGSSTLSLVLIIGFLDSAYVFRLARAASLNFVAMDFFESARLRGDSIGYILGRELLPNILPTLVAEFGLRFCFVFLTISALSFLGLGIQPPQADLGSMVREASVLVAIGDIAPLLPAGAIAILVVAINYVVDAYLNIVSGLDDV